jgi:DegV family protein with EDD domain
MNFVLMSDSCVDMTQQMADELDLKILPLSFRMDDKDYLNYLDESQIDTHEFYEKLRAQKKSVTSAINVQTFMDNMRPFLENGQDILCLAFSSGLSNTYNAAVMAANELTAQFSDRKIYVVDTLCASLGQGLLTYLTAKKRQEGATIEEVRDFAESNKLHLCHWFTVDDLHHLKRGGRISSTTAVVGTMLGIKPVMHVDNDGHLIKVSTVRGRNQSLMALVDHMEQTAINPEEQTVFISHGDCPDDAQKVADEVVRRLHVKRENIFINYIGPVIGTHSGPGTVALFFLGTER